MDTEMDGYMDSGGRATRALRKRLTSIDSDNGSIRPGTPVQSKLATETAKSPLKPRMTRRNAISGTPVETPVKRAVNAVSPVIARSTRQRTASLEATPKNEKKVLHFESLTEEDNQADNKTASPDFSFCFFYEPEDVAGIVIEKEDFIFESPEKLQATSPASSKAKSPKLHQATTDANTGRHSLKMVAFASNNLDDECVKNSYPKTPASVKNKSFANNKTDDTYVQAKYSVNESIVSVHDTADVEIAETQQEEITSTQCATKTIAEDDTVVSMAEDKTSNAGEKLEGNDRSIVEEHQEHDTTENVISTNPDESPKSASPTSPESSTAAKSPKLHQATTPAGNVITYANRGRHSHKIVALASNNLDDEYVKNSYPKTPASLKTKIIANNTTDDTSFQATDSVDESIVSVHDTTDVDIAETQQEEIMSTQCATKTIAEYDTVVSMAEDNASNAGEKLGGNDRSIVEEHQEDNNDKLGEKSDAESEIQLKWFNPRVMAKSCKLDNIGKGEETVSVVDECAHVEKKKPKKTFNRAKYNDDSDNESPRDEEYDELLDEEEEEYQEQKYKHVFIDVNDYESGDSMEYEESREIIEHEISADGGESIERHTTDEKEREDAECDNDSFIVSDEKNTVASSYSELDKNVKEPADEGNTIDSYYSEFNKNVKVPGARKKKRDYKRIQRILDTSSDEDDEKSKENSSKRNECSPTKGSDSEDMVRKSESPNKSNKISIQLQCATEDETNSSGDKETHDTSKGRSSTVHNISKAGELKTNANNSHNLSRLSDTALQLQQSYIKDFEDLSVEGDINMSREDILRKLNHSDRFNNSVRDINPDVDVSPDAVSIINTNNIDSEVEKLTSMAGFVCETDLYGRKSVNKESLLNTKHSESHRGEVSAISENKSDQEDGCTGRDSGEEVENIQDQEKAEAKKARALSVSFGSFKQQQNKNALQKEALQQSFTVGVSVNDGELETEVIQNVFTTSKPVTASSSSSASLSSNEDTKSFGGTTAETSVVDIDDVRHLHKRSKLESLENSIAESVGNTKKDNSMCLKVSHSSTPYKKGSMRHILNRCDEILEAANRAKLEAKLNYRKTKIRLPKKNKKVLQKIDKTAAPISKEIRKRDKAKIAVTKAKPRDNEVKQRKIAPEPNRLPPVVLQSLAACQSVAKKNKKKKLKEVNFGCRNYFTAGNAIEMLATPKKKKKSEIIRLPTGNVYVEPLSPTRGSIISCNGMMFHESPISPSAVGFTVCNAQSPNGNKGRKRKRIADGRKQAFPTPIWSQSGIFMEEEIPTARPPHFVSQARITKRAQRQANNNFKQSAMNR